MAEHHTPFALAAQCFPPTLRNLLHALPVTQQATAEELRLRAGSGLRVVDETGREQLVPDTQWVTQRELQDVIEIATHASFHNAMEPLCRGYLPLPGATVWGWPAPPCPRGDASGSSGACPPLPSASPMTSPAWRNQWQSY